jgi:hypothetical protein
LIHALILLAHAETLLRNRREREGKENYIVVIHPQLYSHCGRRDLSVKLWEKITIPKGEPQKGCESSGFIAPRAFDGIYRTYLPLG